ncbi:MAG: thioredoxin family protein [Candidatus Acidiferrum sp.]
MATSAAASKKVVSHNEWIAARTAFLKKEKEFSRLRDELSKQRRELPWEKVEKNYVFEGPNGKVTLADLFEGRSQLIVYHFMFGPNWAEGCPSCSYLGDHFDGMLPHINARDVTFTAISRGPMPQIAAFKKRMGWKFNWVSSYGTDFNFDYHVSFTPEERAKGKMEYNYSETNFPSEEGPGASAFYKEEAGNIFHTYSTYARGLDIFLGAYNFLDIAPKGRNEEGLTHTMAWVRHHDKYEKNQAVDAKAPYVEPAKTHDCCKE